MAWAREAAREGFFFAFLAICRSDANGQPTSSFCCLNGVERSAESRTCSLNSFQSFHGWRPINCGQQEKVRHRFVGDSDRGEDPR